MIISENVPEGKSYRKKELGYLKAAIFSNISGNILVECRRNTQESGSINVC